LDYRQTICFKWRSSRSCVICWLRVEMSVASVCLCVVCDVRWSSVPRSCSWLQWLAASRGTWHQLWPTYNDSQTYSLGPGPTKTFVFLVCSKVKHSSQT